MNESNKCNKCCCALLFSSTLFRCSYQINKLRQPKSQFDRDFLGVIDHRPNESVIIGQEVIVQPLGIGIGLH